MSKSIPMAIILTVAIFTISLSLVSEQVLAQTMMMSPRQQMMMGTNSDQITCADGKVLMMNNQGIPACVNPDSYLRLAERGWGNFDMNMMTNNPEQMQRVMNSMMNNPQTGKLWYDTMTNDPQHLQTMTNQMMTTMTNNPQMMGPMMNSIMNDPELRQQMMNMMMKHQ